MPNIAAAASRDVVLPAAQLQPRLQQLLLRLEKAVAALISDQFLVGDFAPFRKRLAPVRRRLAAVVGRRRHRFHKSLGGFRPRRRRHGVVARQLLAHLHPGAENQRHLPVDVPHIGQSRSLRHFLDGFRHLVAGGKPLRVLRQTSQHERGHRTRPRLGHLFGGFRDRLPKVRPARSLDRQGQPHSDRFLAHRIPRNGGYRHRRPPDQAAALFPNASV